MQGGGCGLGVVELARRAAEAARMEPPARRSRKQRRMQRGGGVIDGVVQQARRAAAAARAEPAALLAALKPGPMRQYRGVQRQNNRYSTVIWHSPTKRLVYLGSYGTPEEAAYAFDAAARILRGRTAKLNFPEPTSPEPHGVSTDLVLALPTPAAAAPAQQQASFANWLRLPASSSAHTHARIRPA